MFFTNSKIIKDHIFLEISVNSKIAGLSRENVTECSVLFSFSQASLLLWTLDDAKERVRNPALSLSLHTHPAQVPLACHLITLDTARGLKYEKKYLPSAFYVGER